METFAVAPGRVFAADPWVTLMAMHGLALLHLGRVAQGRGQLERARARARLLGQPIALVVVAWYEALFELRLGRAERVKALAEEMSSLVKEFSLGQGRTASGWFRGWADARLGRPQDGYERIKAAHEEDLRFGMVSADSETLGYMAEALMLAGNAQAAQAALNEALAAVQKYSERIYLAPLLLTQAAIARARGERADSETAIRRAVAEARTQEASWFELRALLDLCETGAATDTDRRALAAVLERLPDAADTEAASRSRALLGN
jgi:ATP/maltotriose-dependent transcriptional regulator MalT